MLVESFGAWSFVRHIELKMAVISPGHQKIDFFKYGHFVYQTFTTLLKN